MRSTLLIAAVLLAATAGPSFARGGHGGEEGGAGFPPDGRTPAQIAAVEHNAEVAARLQEPAPYDPSLLAGAKDVASTPRANGQFVTLAPAMPAVASNG